jgi:hypothetical protein
MDTEILVGSHVEDGARLLDQLVRDDFEVGAAFWIKTSEEGLWLLYIASPSVDEGRLGEAYGKAYASLAKVPDSSISPSDIKLVNDADPIARDVIAIRDRRPANVATRYRGKRIGHVSIVEAYIYSKSATRLAQATSKYGARVYLLNDGVAVVKQTIKRGVEQNAPYVIDRQRERHVDPGDDAALGAAVRAALEGRL